jgi:hypothetical protein
MRKPFKYCWLASNVSFFRFVHMCCLYDPSSGHFYYEFLSANAVVFESSRSKPTSQKTCI